MTLEVTDDTFEQEVLQSKLPVLVDFYAQWCGPCKAMAPVLDQVAEEMQDTIKVVKLDVDQSPRTVATYSIRAMPTLILFKDGKPLANKRGAIVQKVTLADWITGGLLASPLPTNPGKRHTEQFQLSNGMDVVVVHDPRAPEVTHTLWVKAGHADEPKGAYGIANYVAHLSGSSTKGDSPTEPRKISLPAMADLTRFSQAVPGGQMQAIMQINADRMTRLPLDGDEMRAGWGALVERYREMAAHPLAQFASDMIGERDPSHVPLSVQPVQMANLSRADALQFWERYYAPNNAVLVVSGDVTPSEVKRLADETYGKVPSKPGVGARARVQGTLKGARRIAVSDPKIRQSEFRRAHVAPSYTTANPGAAEALEVLASVLTRRLRHALVEPKLASQARASYAGHQMGAGSFSILASFESGGFEALEPKIDAVIDDIRTNGVTESELDAEKSLLTAVFMADGNSAAALAARYGSAIALGRTQADVDGWPEAIATVRAADVKNAANTYLNKDRSVTGCLIKEPQEERAVV